MTINSEEGTDLKKVYCLYLLTISTYIFLSMLNDGTLLFSQALFKKGVSEADAENALKLVFESKESGEQKSKFMDHLVVQASKQWQRGQNLPKETRKARIIRWLQYRGFSWNVISSILKNLES